MKVSGIDYTVENATRKGDVVTCKIGCETVDIDLSTLKMLMETEEKKKTKKWNVVWKGIGGRKNSSSASTNAIAVFFINSDEDAKKMNKIYNTTFVLPKGKIAQVVIYPSDSQKGEYNHTFLSDTSVNSYFYAEVEEI